AGILSFPAPRTRSTSRPTWTCSTLPSRTRRWRGSPPWTSRSGIMRRHLCTNKHHLASILISGSGLKINLNLRKAYLNGEDLHLTPKQFALLSVLAGSMGEVVTKEELYQAAWAD